MALGSFPRSGVGTPLGRSSGQDFRTLERGTRDPTVIPAGNAGIQEPGTAKALDGGMRSAFPPYGLETAEQCQVTPVG